MGTAYVSREDVSDFGGPRSRVDDKELRQGGQECLSPMYGRWLSWEFGPLEHMGGTELSGSIRIGAFLCTACDPSDGHLSQAFRAVTAKKESVSMGWHAHTRDGPLVAYHYVYSLRL